MKVLKFGGTSVGSVESILSLQKIVESREEPVIVVVSALGGITDQLIGTSKLAVKGDEAYKEKFQAMIDRHHKMIDTIIPEGERRDRLTAVVDGLFAELRSIYYGVCLIRDLSPKTSAAIVSYGERLSSNIASTLIKDCQLFDSRDFIKTQNKHGRHVLDRELTNRLIQETFKELPKVALCPGFISSDEHTGEVTNLGRGGSDYTAAIIAAALDAEVLEIWTDVDGFMTGDPRAIPAAYTINELSYVEAMELCNFGAKVIYPPTIYPVCIKNIPILVKNTFNPEDPGSIIKEKIDNDRKPIKGISSISGTALITITGLSMVGVIGVNRRIFTALADNGISVFMVSQASSENSTSIGVKDEDAEEAVRVLNEEFSKEIVAGAMFPMHVEKGLSTIAIVGENMKHTPGIAGKLFGTLGRSGISVIACAQGASETNISFVVNSRYLHKALNVIHESFFLSEYKELNLFICGVGTVGGNLVTQIHQQYEELMRSCRVKLNVIGIANSTHAIFNADGIDLSTYKEQLEKGETCDERQLRDHIIGMNLYNSVFVDCTASADVAALYQDFLEHNISVVAANKVAASGSYKNYSRLKLTAVRRGVKYLFETNVGAGLPVIATINDLRNSGDKVLKIEAVLSGTLTYIFNTISAKVPFSEAVRQAKEQHFSEPDPRVDLSGKDVVRKLVILAREAGYKVEQDEVEKQLFLPESFFQGSLEEFWKNLPSMDPIFEKKRKQLEKENKRWRFVAKFDHGATKVGLEAVGPRHPFYDLGGSSNIIALTTERYKEFPMTIQGYGAGAGVTAAGVFANIMQIANI